MHSCVSRWPGSESGIRLFDLRHLLKQSLIRLSSPSSPRLTACSTSTMSQTDVPTLPIPLILLVHLHILEYPQANNPEYDHQIFNPRTRGLRERAKIMEDVAYFLVGKVEGKSAKSVRAPRFLVRLETIRRPLCSSSLCLHKFQLPY